jgi:hypothetical protein
VAKKKNDKVIVAIDNEGVVCEDGKISKKTYGL